MPERLKAALPLLAYLRPHLAKFAASLLCLLVSSLAGLAFPLVTGLLIDGAIHAKSPSQVSAMRWAGDLSLNQVAGLMILVILIQAVCSYFQNLWLAEVGEKSVAALRLDA